MTEISLIWMLSITFLYNFQYITKELTKIFSFRLFYTNTERTVNKTNFCLAWQRVKVPSKD